MFKLIGHAQLIDFYNDMIIEGSKDRSIKLWTCQNRRRIINKKSSHPNDIRQI